MALKPKAVRLRDAQKAKERTCRNMFSRDVISYVVDIAGEPFAR